MDGTCTRSPMFMTLGVIEGKTSSHGHKGALTSCLPIMNYDFFRDAFGSLVMTVLLFSRHTSHSPIKEAYYKKSVHVQYSDMNII